LTASSPFLLLLFSRLSVESPKFPPFPYFFNAKILFANAKWGQKPRFSTMEEKNHHSSSSCDM
jgi:hypothetical protein